MLSHLDERLCLPDGAVVGHGGRLGGRAAAGKPAETARPRRVPPGDGPAGLALRARRARRSRSASCCPHRQNTVHVSYRLVAGHGAVRLQLRPSRPLPAARAAGEHAARRAVRAHGRRRPLRDLRRARRYRRCGCACTARRPTFTSPASTIRRGPLPRRAEPRVRGHGRSLEPGLLPGRRSTRTAPRHPRGLHRALGGHRRARSRTRRCGAERTRRRRLHAVADPRARTGPGGGAGAGRRPVHDHAGRPRGGRRAAPAPRATRCGRHRRLPLVHGLGPRHDDQPRGPDAGDRAATSRPATSCAPSPTTCATA